MFLTFLFHLYYNTHEFTIDKIIWGNDTHRSATLKILIYNRIKILYLKDK